VTFIAEATRYLQPNELRLEEIAELVTLKGISRNDGASLVFNVLRNPNDMRDAVYRGIAVGMGKLYEEKELERFGVGVDWMKANHYLNLFESDHVGYLPGAIGKSIDCIVDVVSKHLTGACERGIGFQKIVFDLTGDYEKAFSAPPTAHAWAASCARPFIRLDWRFIDSITILKELKRLDLEGQRQEASFISFGAAIFGSLLGVPPVSVSGQATVLDTVGPDLLSFIASATFQKAEFRTAALTALLVARETVMDHSHYKGMEQLNLDLVSTIKSFLRNNEKMISVETRRLVRQYIEGPGRIVREEFQEVPKSPQSLLGWSNEFV